MDGITSLDSRLSKALEAWTDRSRSSPLERWLEQQLDDDGGPGRLPLPSLAPVIRRLLEARDRRPGWPGRIDDGLTNLVRILLRTSTIDRRPATGDSAGAERDLVQDVLHRFARLFPKSAEARVIAWWVPGVASAHVPPPLPAWSSERRVLAVLRPGWQKGDDLIAVDHRQAGPSTQFGLVGAGVSWLGHDWSPSTASEGKATAARPTCWQSSSAADLAEWTYTAGGLRHTRTALLLRGRSLALFADQVEGIRAAQPDAPPIESTWQIPEGIVTAPIPGSRGLLLRPTGPRKSAQVLPISLPSLDYHTDRGAFSITPERRLSLSVAPVGRRCWLPLLVSWDSQRNRKPLSWRVLTVSRDSKVCGRDVAFAVRVSWGREETLVIYRSLAAPASRVFLGHQTTARFFVGRFTSDGDVEPILSVD
ncbi:hypothetical protein [Aquisphaera insulae]|uniref:hypothetical protein n=1 Tax=Aquisphaera insulae TaxID=2712864 RepID=UPI0013EBDFAE|nr:hypothetical protein [Aquisphaera insulae]